MTPLPLRLMDLTALKLAVEFSVCRSLCPHDRPLKLLIASQRGVIQDSCHFSYSLNMIENLCASPNQSSCSFKALRPALGRLVNFPVGQKVSS